MDHTDKHDKKMTERQNKHDGEERVASSSSSSEEDGEIKDKIYQHDRDDDRKAEQKAPEGFVRKGDKLK